MRTRFVAGGTLLAALLLPAAASASSLGPADGFAGEPPGFSDCTTCHFSFEVNSGDGGLQLLGLPSEYVPGSTYSLTVEIADPGQSRWGFELTVLDDTDFLLEGGALQVTDPVNTQVSLDSNGEVDYLKQTLDGCYTGTNDGPVSWSFDWIAPGPEKESVTFYLAGNAADGDFSFSNDYIYTRSYTLQRSDPTPTVESTWGRVKSFFTRAGSSR